MTHTHISEKAGNKSKPCTCWWLLAANNQAYRCSVSCRCQNTGPPKCVFPLWAFLQTREKGSKKHTQMWELECQERGPVFDLGSRTGPSKSKRRVPESQPASRADRIRHGKMGWVPQYPPSEQSASKLIGASANLTRVGHGSKSKSYPQ